MDVLQGLMAAMEPQLLLYAFLGALLGTFVGVLPGLGPTATMAMLLPVVLTLENPAAAIIMLAGVYYGSQYGNSTASILTNIPGTVAGLPACFDGFPMTQKGRAGQALWMAAISSFMGATFGILMITIVGVGFARFALYFDSSAYLALLAFALTAVIVLSGGSVSKALGAAMFGMILASVGIDEVSGGQLRLTFGFEPLRRGLDLVPLVVGLFGIGEVLRNADRGTKSIFSGKLGKMIPRGQDLKRGLLGATHGTLLGFFQGLLPGATTAISSFMAYDIEKRLSKRPEKFGKGAIEGVAAPEAANNANAQAGFIPLFAFGIPTEPPLAILLATFMLYGLQPGPLLFTGESDIVWVIIGSMYVGNVMLLILNLPLVGIWARISIIPYKYLGPLILAVCVIAAYSVRNTMFDVAVALVAGVVGYLMRKADWPIGPLLLGLILGPMIEVRLAQTLSLPGGLSLLVTKPIPLAFLIAAVIMIALSFKMKTGPQSDPMEDHTDDEQAPDDER